MLKRLPTVAVLWLLPVIAFAVCPGGSDCVIVDTGVDSDVPTILQGFVNVLLQWSALTALGLFLLGAVIMVGSGGEEAYLSAGKKIMKAALIGFVIVLASWLTLSTVIWFISR